MPDALPITPLSQPFQAVMRPPGSKSLTNRALLLAALAEGRSALTGVLFSEDTRHMMDALTALGFALHIDEPNETVTVTGAGGSIPASKADLFLGNAGTATRFLTAACCLGAPGSAYTITGVRRMHERPIGQLVGALRQLGANIEYLENDGYPPLKVHGGGLRGDTITLPTTLSSQYTSALLQIGPYLPGGLTIAFDGPVTSLPYIQMTLRLMHSFGVPHEMTGDCERITLGERRYRPLELEIEPDASNGSYFLAAAAIIPHSEVTVPGLSQFPLQGDALFCDVLAQMGAASRLGPNSVWVAHGDELRGIDTPLNDMPDMAQTLAVVALFAEGETVIRNVGNLRVKETDRMAAIKEECEKKLGAMVTLTEHDIHIKPPTDNILRHPDGEPISDARPVTITTYDDHRMAMSFAVAGLRQPGIRIAEPACVNKTYPNFFADLATLATGGNVADPDRAQAGPREVDR